MKKFLVFFVCLLVAGMMTVTANEDCCNVYPNFSVTPYCAVQCGGMCGGFGSCDEPDCMCIPGCMMTCGHMCVTMGDYCVTFDMGNCTCVCEMCHNNPCMCPWVMFHVDGHWNVIDFGTITMEQLPYIEPVVVEAMIMGGIPTQPVPLQFYGDAFVLTPYEGIEGCCCTFSFAPFAWEAMFYISPKADISRGRHTGQVATAGSRGDSLGFSIDVVEHINSAEVNLATVECGMVGVGWTFLDQTLTVLDGANIMITTGGVPAPVGRHIRIANRASATITLYNVSVTAAPRTAAIGMSDNENLELYIEGINTLQGGNDNAGILVSSSSTLVIDGTGKLYTTGGSHSAGIGGNNIFQPFAGHTAIRGDVTVTARGAGNAAGIGGGFYDSWSGGAASGTVHIEGNATVRAYSGAGHANTVAIGPGVNNAGILGTLIAPVYIAPTATVFLDGICATCGYYPCDCFGINPPTGVRGITAPMWAMFVSLAASGALWGFVIRKNYKK